MSPTADAPSRPATARDELTRYVVVVTVIGFVVFASAMAVPGLFTLVVPGLVGAAVVTVLLGRSVGWVALAAPLVPCLIWAAGFAVLIAVATDPDSDERDLATLFAILAVGLLGIGGLICAGAGALWGHVSPAARRRGV